MQDYKCKRCGYDGHQLSNLKKHLMRKQHCEPRLSNESCDDILKSLPGKQIDTKTFICDVCCREYKDASGLHYHKKKGSCNKEDINNNPKKSLQLLHEENRIMKEQIELLMSNSKNKKPEIKDINISKLQLELQYYKNKKNESFYQLLL